VRLLLDTNVFLWWQWRDPALPVAAKAAIDDRENDVLVSAATIWEIGIKRRIGKLDFDGSPIMACNDAGFELLGITALHAEAAGDLPRHHGDPFDRMLIAQAQLEHLTIVTSDPQFRLYEAPVLDPRIP
jgi:PIN domain nuclease of toxin-antitoxin system